MTEIDLEQFKRIKEKGEELYKSLSKVYYPYFKEEISFNAKGLEHLKFKEKDHARSLEDQLIRFRILKLAPEVLSQTKTVQGISEQRVFELVRSNNRTEKVLVDAMYYEFIAILDGVRVRVVIKQIGTAPKYFWSIIPFWKVSRGNGKRKHHYGNPEYD